MIKFIKHNPVKLIFLSLLLGFVAYRIATAEPKGYCAGKAYNGKVGVFLTDEEFIFAALKVIPGVYTESGGGIVNPSDEVIKNYMEEYPDCCLVYRDEEKYVSNGPHVRSSLLSSLLGMEQRVVVAYRDIVAMKSNPTFTVEGNPRFMIEGNSAAVSVCGYVYLD